MLHQDSKNYPISIQDLKKATNGGFDFYQFVYNKMGVKLSKHGSYRLRNPFYDDKNPSLSISPLNGEYLFHDFGDEAYSGDVITFAALYYKLDPKRDIPKILEYACRDLNIKIEKRNGLHIHRNKSNQVEVRNKNEIKKQIRFIDNSEKRFIFIKESALNPSEPTQKDCDEIYDKIKKRYSIETLIKAGVKINRSEKNYGLIFFGTEDIIYNPNQLSVSLHCEGRTDLLTLIELGADEAFRLVSHFNKNSIIEIDEGEQYFLLDRDVTKEHIISRIKSKKSIKCKFIRLPDKYKDISELHFQDNIQLDYLLELINHTDSITIYPKIEKNILDNLENPDFPNNPVNNASIKTDSDLPMVKDLMNETFPELMWVAEGLIPEGYTILAAKPKHGKSLIVLSLALCCAKGTKFLGKYQCQPKRVLYVTLEDSKRRLNSRLKNLLSYEHPDNKDIPDNFFYLTKIDMLDEAGLKTIKEIIIKNMIELVIIDPLKKAVPKPKRDNSYEEEYDVGAKLQALAIRFSLSLIAIFHSRKNASKDSPFDNILGSTGISAAADTLMVMIKDRNNNITRLHITGRDIEEKTLILEFNNGFWTLLGLEDEISTGKIDIAWGTYFSEGKCSNDKLLNSLMKEFNISRSSAYERITNAITNKIIIRNKKGEYRLNATIKNKLENPDNPDNLYNQGYMN
ncbi:MAG: AAA family ATPase [Bacteroidetes bacterium]|nr:AAA family ATPase [Bacteroidota bacterium]